MLTSVFAMAQEKVRVTTDDGSFVMNVSGVSFNVEEWEVPFSVSRLQAIEERSEVKVSMYNYMISQKLSGLKALKSKNALVDLGLPSGNLWTKFNIGATSASEIGEYFMWNNGPGDYFGIEKGTARSESLVLDRKDDLASILLGDNYRIPSTDEFDELADNCKLELIDNYMGTGVDGLIVYKMSTDAEHEYTTADTHIFFPNTGYRHTQKFEITDLSSGCYWTSNFAWDCDWNDGLELAYQYYFMKGKEGSLYKTYQIQTHRNCVIRAVCTPIVVLEDNNTSEPIEFKMNSYYGMEIGSLQAGHSVKVTVPKFNPEDFNNNLISVNLKNMQSNFERNLVEEGMVNIKGDGFLISTAVDMADNMLIINIGMDSYNIYVKSAK